MDIGKSNYKRQGVVLMCEDPIPCLCVFLAIIVKQVQGYISDKPRSVLTLLVLKIPKINIGI